MLYFCESDEKSIVLFCRTIYFISVYKYVKFYSLSEQKDHYDQYKYILNRHSKRAFEGHDLSAIMRRGRNCGKKQIHFTDINIRNPQMY